MYIHFRNRFSKPHIALLKNCWSRNLLWLLSVSLLEITGATICMAESKPLRLVAITQIVEHPSADQTRYGVLNALKAGGYEDTVNIELRYDNAQNSLSTAAAIASNFVSLKPACIVAITTPSAQTVAQATRGTGIPVVFASVTDPLNAKIVSSLSHPGQNITGASDFPPIEAQIELIRTLTPKVKKIGVVYNPGELNSVRLLALLKEAAKPQGIHIIESVAIKSSEVSTSAHAIAGKVDAFFISLDNTALSAMEAILNIASKHKIPVYSSDPDSVRQGALASISNTQYQTGYLAGQMVIRVLNHTDPGAIPVESPKTPDLYINQNTAEKLHISIPSNLTHTAHMITTKPKKPCHAAVR